MAISDKLWDAISRLVKVADKVEGLSKDVADLAGDVEIHEQHLNALDRRLVRIETVLDLAMGGRAPNPKLPRLPPVIKRRK